MNENDIFVKSNPAGQISYYPGTKNLAGTWAGAILEAMEIVPAVSKKDQILSLYLAGVHEVAELAQLTNARPSYVAEQLRQANLLYGYFDLYTSSEQPMNVYSKFFTKKLGFKNRVAAQRSVDFLDQLYHQFERIGDRAGQHHTLLMALTMHSRARWAGKATEALPFGQWLATHLASTRPAPAPNSHRRPPASVRSRKEVAVHATNHRSRRPH